MSDYVEQGQVKQVIIQIKDGSTWTAEIGLDGKVRLLTQLSSADPDRTPPKESPDEGEAEKPAEPEDGEAGDAAEGEPGEGEPDGDGWGEFEEGEELEDKYSEDEINKLIEKMQNRELTDNAKERPADRKIRRGMPKNLMAKLKDSAFKARLSSVMLDNKYDRRVRGRTRGKLDMNRLYKVPTGSRSVFLQKESRKGKQYNVVLLADRSGSMGGRAAELAAESAVFLTKQLTDIGVNVGIVTFDSRVDVVKELTEKPDYEYIYSEVSGARGSNRDYDGMRRAYHMLQHAPAGKKILIMLSDGEPVGYKPADTYDSKGKLEHVLKDMPGWEGYNDDDEYEEGTPYGYTDYDTKEHFHHLAKSNKDVSSIGIGIQQGGWQMPDHTVIHNVDDLKKTIIATLRKHINRG